MLRRGPGTLLQILGAGPLCSLPVTAEESLLSPMSSPRGLLSHVHRHLPAATPTNRSLHSTKVACSLHRLTQPERCKKFICGRVFNVLASSNSKRIVGAGSLSLAGTGNPDTGLPDGVLCLELLVLWAQTSNLGCGYLATHGV